MKQRLITGIIAGGGFLGLCLAGGIWYHGLVLVMALIGFYEFVRMTKTPAFGGTAVIGYLGVLYVVFPWKLLGLDMPLNLLSVFWLLMLLFLVVTVVSKNGIPIGQVALLFLGMVYVGVGFAYLADTRSTADGHGLFWTFLMLASIWSSDAGAYFVGRRFGKNKLWPAISPNKTVEGAIGGIICAVIVAVIFALASGGLLTIGRALILGVSAAVVGQMGDLIQSAYKRVYGIKDSGNLLPGHGGILDRCDSWIAVFPFVHILSLLPVF
ncbi:MULTISPECIES: phosphatidate cytidylyltransferase [Paenibacillus]|uniref:Phosphatidate cytidylyltransferase n=1 Tax=Paenibacillus vini TaxID=1476024 RepID=A0ABQ4M8F8_9BACL|nr:MULTISPECIES: phosphatidate cytidylyltransferase [Paenibacillus]MBQ4898974.1 phosphatidate cytidylyltransferase [Paenibacillus sp. Marseille-P2973]MDN4066875.1 phosphatidate cytidylyltransferase [Paenibacillus vini]GIP52271.1 phosphatidate cytidylyltransferase [Paenibacillus vini]